MVNDQEDEAAQRAKLVIEIAEDLVESGLLPPDQVAFIPARIKIACRAYFVLSNAYKSWRIKDGHRTEEPKIAALLCVALMKFPAFVPLNPEMAETVAAAKANEMFAVAVGLSIIDRSISLEDANHEDFWFRIFDILTEIDCETLESVLIDINSQIFKKISEYKMAVHDRDHLHINALISIFELMSGKIKIQTAANNPSTGG